MNSVQACPKCEALTRERGQWYKHLAVAVERWQQAEAHHRMIVAGYEEELGRVPEEEKGNKDG